MWTKKDALAQRCICHLSADADVQSALTSPPACFPSLSLVKKDAGMLDAFGKGASEDIRRAKQELYTQMTWDPGACMHAIVWRCIDSLLGSKVPVCTRLCGAILIRRSEGEAECSSCCLAASMPHHATPHHTAPHRTAPHHTTPHTTPRAHAHAHAHAHHVRACACTCVDAAAGASLYTQPPWRQSNSPPMSPLVSLHHHARMHAHMPRSSCMHTCPAAHACTHAPQLMHTHEIR